MTVSRSDTRTLPFVVEAQPPGSAIVPYVTRKRDQLRAALLVHGAVLFRGFAVGGLPELRATVRALSGEPLPYAERSSPRSALEGNIYTSTDYPPEEEIFLHNENSYQASWPRTLYFYCDQPPATQGATPLADIRGVYEAIDPAVREEFAKRRWMVVRNFHERFGTTWRYVFDTEDRAEVEEYCRTRDIEVEWRGHGGLRTRAVRDPIHCHPDTGVPVWFNHITFFHHSSLPPEVRVGLLELFGAEDLPTNTYYGDGGVIPDDVVAHLRDCYRAASVRFDWMHDDVLMVDNMRAAHGREPFTGSRRIAVAMAEPHRPGGAPTGV